MFCKNCGRELDENAVICPGCGVATDNFGAPRKTANTLSAEPGIPTARKTNGYAIAGLVLAIAGICGGNYLFCVPSILGLVFGIIGFVKSKTYNSGYGLGLAAIIVGGIGLFIWLMIWIIAGAMLIAIINGMYYYPYY